MQCRINIFNFSSTIQIAKQIRINSAQFSGSLEKPSIEQVSMALQNWF